MSLQEELRALPKDLQAELERHYFKPEWLLALAERLSASSTHSNIQAGTIEPPGDGDVVSMPAMGSEESRQLEHLGDEALREGQVGLVVLAGGMATRMGGVVKSLVEALPGQRFLDLRLNEARSLERRGGRRVPLWMMTSNATNQAIVEALGDRLDPQYLATFVQFLSVRLTPEGTLFKTDAGEPSVHAPGHGDLPDALRNSGLLQNFRESGGKYLTITNIDNLGASLDPRIIGFHIKHGKPLTCEVVDKHGTDKGGIPLRVDGRPVVLEEFRIPPTFDPASVRVFSTNTFHASVDALSDLEMDWSYFTVNKKVEGRPAIQFERLIGELTSTMDTQFLHVPRTGKDSRFLPVKDFPELEARQQEITAVARDRGMIE